jgi:hypothetical protein
MKRSRRQAEPSAQFSADALGMAEGCLHAPRRGADARIAKVDGIGSKGPEAPPQAGERRVMGQEKVEEVLELMRSWHDCARLLEQSLEVLFR